MIISEKILKKWGGETLITNYDHSTGAWIIIAIHSTKRGPAVGGTRMKTYLSLEEAVQDVLELSKAMTYKYATVNMSWGRRKNCDIDSKRAGQEKPKRAVASFWGNDQTAVLRYIYNRLTYFIYITILTLVILDTRVKVEQLTIITLIEYFSWYRC